MFLIGVCTTILLHFDIKIGWRRYVFAHLDYFFIVQNQPVIT
jgi:hypothetical protein